MADRFAAFEAFLKTTVAEEDGHRVRLHIATGTSETWVITRYDEIGVFVRQVGQTMQTRFFPWSSIVSLS